MTTHIAKAAGSNDLRLFLDDPIEYFGWSFTKIMTVERGRLEDLQLEGLRLRFSELKDGVAMLSKLAVKQGIGDLQSFEDVVPLLFEHTMYKSYPASLLADNRFDRLTAWLGKLTTHDLSGIDTSGLDGVDAWLERMDAVSPLMVSHSSGTSGTVSFLPWSKLEFDHHAKQFPVCFGQELNEPVPADPIPHVHCIYPYYRSGRVFQLRENLAFLKYLCGGDETRFHAAYPQAFSSDLAILAGRVRAAKVKGELNRLDVPQTLLARVREFEHQRQFSSTHIQDFMASAADRLRGERVWMGGPWNVMHTAAEAALARGIRKAFAPNSIITSGGGAKGMVPPPDWKQKVLEFTGVERIKMAYIMSEVSSANMMCAHNRYHIMPWVIPFVLDPETSAPRPRKGIVTGRAAFFDLLPHSRWGGFITGDEVTMHWDEPCPCGATTSFVDDGIQRFSEKTGGDDKITCAAQADAHNEAMEFLNRFQ